MVIVYQYGVARLLLGDYQTMSWLLTEVRYGAEESLVLVERGLDDDQGKKRPGAAILFNREQ